MASPNVTLLHRLRRWICHRSWSIKPVSVSFALDEYLPSIGETETQVHVEKAVNRTGRELWLIGKGKKV